MSYFEIINYLCHFKHNITSEHLFARFFLKILDLVFDSVQPSGDNLYLLQEDAVSW